MTKNKEHWIKSAWVISIGTAIFSLLLTIIYDYSKEKTILTTVWEILKRFANLIWTGLNFDIKVWWIIIVIIFILILRIISKSKKKETFKPDFYSYREDRFKRWKWTWSWHFNNNKNAWMISNLRAHCPKCDTPMMEHSNIYGLSFDCPRCEFKARDGECDEQHKVERIIHDNIDRKRADNAHK